MKKLVVLLGLLGGFTVPAMAQVTPRFEVSAGYTFQRWEIPTALQPPSGLNMNGWNVGAAYHFTKWLALTADITGTYNSMPATTGDTNIYSYLFGPRVYPIGYHKLTPYVHALFGIGYYKETVSTPPPTALTENDFSWGVGGGIDYRLNEHFSVRLGQFDYQQTRFFGAPAGGINNQNNFKYSAGLVLRLGRK